jgi:hypothetical protein
MLKESNTKNTEANRKQEQKEDYCCHWKETVPERYEDGCQPSESFEVHQGG